ncbi:MAG TPA: membrane dipeptidase [Puia sp.]|jgi:membrane dipeptidase|nr:membrane dipeptidase [Puia sp.]
MFIVDAHLDLSMNAMEWNRDLRLSVDEIRAREFGMTDKPDRARGTVSLPALRRGGIGLVVATQIARYVAPDNPLPGWHSPLQAWAQTQGQLAWYRTMEAAGEMVMIRDLAGLERHVSLWTEGVGEGGGAEDAGQGGGPEEAGEGGGPGRRGVLPVGYILSLEGADSIVTPEYLQRAYEYGLRAVGPAHYGPGRYANGTDSRGALSREGRELLREMERLGIILDVTHLCDDAFRDAMELFDGPVWASHNNCRALVAHNRQFSDDMIRTLIEKGAVIGGALDAWMMVPGWVRGKSDPRAMRCNLEKVIDHLDHICQIAGNALHVGMGSDLDGAFGKEQCPYDLETIADLRQLPELLGRRGYSAGDITNVLHGNWLRFLRDAWRSR